MDYYVNYRKSDGMVVGDMHSDLGDDYEKLIISEAQYKNLANKINVRVIDGALLFDEFKPTPSMEQFLGQYVTDLELKLLSMEAKLSV